MKNTVKSLILAVRHGWRCYNALAGFFAKQKIRSLLLAWMLIAMTSALSLIALTFIGCGNDTTPTHTHEWEWKVTSPATETADGVETETCITCGQTKGTRPIDKLPHVHQWGDWTETTAPTCTEAGEETRTCTLDATHKETRAGAAAIGHQWGEWSETTAPTNTADGEETRICTHDATHKETRPIVTKTYDIELKDGALVFTVEYKAPSEEEPAYLAYMKQRISTVVNAPPEEEAAFEATTYLMGKGNSFRIKVEYTGSIYESLLWDRPIQSFKIHHDFISTATGSTLSYGSIISAFENVEGILQTATITGLLDNNASATVQGYLTDSEWGGDETKEGSVAYIIKTALNAKFAPRPESTKEIWRTVFGRGVTIIVEASPEDYTDYKTVGDGKTVYLSLAATNATRLDAILNAMIANALGGNTSTVATIQPKQKEQTA